MYTPLENQLKRKYEKFANSAARFNPQIDHPLMKLKRLKLATPTPSSVAHFADWQLHLVLDLVCRFLLVDSQWFNVSTDMNFILYESLSDYIPWGFMQRWLPKEKFDHYCKLGGWLALTNGPPPYFELDMQAYAFNCLLEEGPKLFALPRDRRIGASQFPLNYQSTLSTYAAMVFPKARYTADVAAANYRDTYWYNYMYHVCYSRENNFRTTYFIAPERFEESNPFLRCDLTPALALMTLNRINDATPLWDTEANDPQLSLFSRYEAILDTLYHIDEHLAAQALAAAYKVDEVLFIR